jgi:hypothetical protein
LTCWGSPGNTVGGEGFRRGSEAGLIHGECIAFIANARRGFPFQADLAAEPQSCHCRKKHKGKRRRWLALEMTRRQAMTSLNRNPQNRSSEMKRRNWHLAILLLTLTVMTARVSTAQEQGSTRAPSTPQAMPLLKSMSETLARAEHFSVTIRDDYDVVQESGQKIEFGEVRRVTVSRPDRLRIEVARSNGQKGLVLFDGKDITVYTANDNIYATTSREGTLDQAIKYVVGDLKVRMPLALLFLSTLPAELEQRVIAADYVETTRIEDVPFDHLAVRTAAGVDFQVWVARGGQPLPGRIVITYLDQPGQPQFRADLSNWNLSPEVSDTLFAFTPPQGAERIQFLGEVRNAAAAPTPKKPGKGGKK